MPGKNEASGSEPTPQPARPKRVRDYSAEYRRRQERAQQSGFGSYWAQRRYRVEAARGEINNPTEFQQKRAILRKFNVTAAEFQRMRAANMEHAGADYSKWTPRGADADQVRKRLSEAVQLNTYNVDIDIAVNDWSERRVGYITSFYRAIVDPRTNYDSLKDATGQRKLWHKRYPLTNRYQADLLVKYAGIMGVSEFERRYGGQIANLH